MLVISRFIVYILGIIILTLGVSFAICSNLGTSPLDALLVGLSVKVGLTVGSWEIIISIILICLNSVLKQQTPDLLGLATAFITGIGIDLWLIVLQNTLVPDLRLAKIIYFGIGLIITGLGTAIYLNTSFAPMPIDKFMLIIRDLTRINILLSRTLIYFIFLILAFIVGGPIGIGTLLTVCLGGPILNCFMPRTKRLLDLLLSSYEVPPARQNNK